MADHGKQLGQLQVQLSMEMNVIETNQYFLQKDFVLQVQIWHKKGPNEL